MQLEQLKALTAIVDHGTFEAAAAALQITPSAVSQRIKALEATVGHMVVQRGTPCVPTEAGAVLVRMARGIAVLEADAQEALGAGDSWMPIPVAVNADSLETWFRPVLFDAAAWPDPIRLEVEDQAHSIRLLRQGEVIGAVTAEPVSVNGCSSEPLGAMRYLPVATRPLRDRFTRGGRIDWARMPLLRVNAKDQLQHSYLARRRVMDDPPVVQVPTSRGFVVAARAGLGWGMVPEEQIGDSLDTGELVLLGRDHIDQPLHWQVWKLPSPRIERVTESVRAAAQVGLRRNPRTTR